MNLHLDTNHISYPRTVGAVIGRRQRGFCLLLLSTVIASAAFPLFAFLIARYMPPRMV